MNKEAANTMLKFLEEPVDNTYGFFITNNIGSVISTILSRCEVIDVFFDNEINEKLNIEKDDYERLYSIVKDYISSIEVEKDIIMSNKKYIDDLEKEDIANIFKIIFEIYNGILNKNEEYKEDFGYLCKLSFDNIKKKLTLIVEILKRLSYNVNQELLLDKFVLEMDGINNEGV